MLTLSTILKDALYKTAETSLNKDDNKKPANMEEESSTEINNYRQLSDTVMELK